MKPLKDVENKYWQDYLEKLPNSDVPLNGHVDASYAGNREITDGLLQLYFDGKKTAGSSIVEDFLSTGDPLPQVGNHWILLNSKDKPSCILRTERIVLHKFKDVPIEIATAEGEGDLSLQYWRDVHRKLYTPFLSSWGLVNLEDATVITEFFKIVHK